MSATCRDTRATVSQLLNGWNGALPEGTDLGPLESFGFTREFAASKDVRLLSPFDLQCIKASGVTFAISAMERVIEERCRGDASKADSLRVSLRERIGTDIRSVKPGSDDAQKLKAALIADGLWSQYLEVAIGPDAEIFTKAPDALVGRLGRLDRRALRLGVEQPGAGDRPRGR